MKYYIFYGLAIVNIFLHLACEIKPEGKNQPSPRNLTSAEKKLIISDNTFGLNVFKALSHTQIESNIFISPISISMALGMILNGAADSTLEAMKNTLKLNGLNENEINESYESLIELMNNLDSDVMFKIANSIWYKKGLVINNEFIQINKQYFDSEVIALDFNNPKSVDQINNWVKQNSNDLIKKIVDRIPEDIIMYLINTIYFKGNWRFEFDPKNSKEGIFNNRNGFKARHPMMNGELSLPFFENEETIILDVPYGDSLFTMTIFLPKEDINQFVASLSIQKISNLLSNLSVNSLDLTLPRFELEYQTKLNNILSDLGMDVAFDESRANFSRIIPLNSGTNLYISEVIHNTYISVDEQGTEAAAVTSVGIGITSVPKSIMIDRPFIFAIRENHTGTLLFLGKVLNL